jgi:polysaccharide deacetylase 2 family uncharacterized protein YibQ
MISPTELSAMQQVAEAAFNETCTIRRVPLVTDGMGGHTEQVADVATVACRVDLIAPYSQAAQDLREIADRVQDQVIRLVNLPHDADARVEDLLVIDGVTYKVSRILEEAWTVVKQVIGIRL